MILAEDWKKLRNGAELGDPSRRAVWFFETRDRALEERGVIVRARSGKKGADTTVKLRGVVTPGPLEARFGKHPGFKIEHDCTEQSSTIAVSLTVDAEAWSRDGMEAPVPTALFSLEQLAMLACGGFAVPWQELQAFGPIAGETWKDEELDVTIERWTIGDEQLIEVSRRSRAPSTTMLCALRELLVSWGVDGAGGAGGKTRWALDRVVDPK